MFRLKNLIVCGLCIGILSCSKDDTTNNNNNNNNNGNSNTLNCSAVPKTFAADVKAIIANNCTAASCHNSGSGNGPGALVTYAQIAAAKVKVRSSVASGAMPQGGTLTSAQKNTILCWIDDGAKDN
jgi:hypothetical protein